MSDYADDLIAAYDEQESAVSEEIETPEAIEPEAAEPEAPAAEAPDPELPPIDYPAAWKKDYSENWGGLPRNVQEYILERETQAQKGINEKGQALSDLQRQFEPFQQMLKPYEQTFAMQGMTAQQGIQQLLAYQQALSENPKDTLMRLAQDYGVDLQQVFEEQPYVDPQVQALQNQVREMEQRHAQAAQHQQRQQHEALVEQIGNFASAVDEQGNAKHPHFEAVYEDIVQLMQLGRASTLDDAYSLAVRLNPDIQAQLSEQQEAEKKAQKAAQAANAREAARSVTSKSSSTAAPPDKSLRDDLADQLDAAGWL